MLEIKVIKSQKVDVNKWDACILESRSKIYNRFAYVNTLAEQWVALVANDYEYVFAIPYKLKWGIKIPYIPPFIQTLDICGRNVNAAIVHAFYQKAKALFLFGVFSGNILSEEKMENIVTKTNYKIDIQNTLLQQSQNYNLNRKRAIKKAYLNDLQLVKDVLPDLTINYYKQAYGHLASYSDKHYNKLLMLIRNGVEKGFCHCFGVSNRLGALIYTVVVFYDTNAAYYILPAPTLEGKALGATSFAIDTLIRNEYSALSYFDFEGSSIPSVAKFYQSFRPIAESYRVGVLNTLPNPFANIINKKLGFGASR